MRPIACPERHAHAHVVWFARSVIPTIGSRPIRHTPPSDLARSVIPHHRIPPDPSHPTIGSRPIRHTPPSDPARSVILESCMPFSSTSLDSTPAPRLSHASPTPAVPPSLQAAARVLVFYLRHDHLRRGNARASSPRVVLTDPSIPSTQRGSRQRNSSLSGSLDPSSPT